MSSIYLIIKKLQKVLTKSKTEFALDPIVAYDRETGFNYMLLSDYDDKELKKLVLQKKKDIVVNYCYWNYKYCDKNNLSEKDKDFLLKKITEDYYVRDDVAMGSLLSLIACYDILLHTYTINEKTVYIELMNSINLDKTIIADFLIHNHFELPLNENYMYLIVKNFNENVLNLIFKKKVLFSPEQIEIILSSVDYGGINFAAEYIFNNEIYDQKQKLLYTNALVNSYDDIIDTVPIIYLSSETYKPSLAYYLFSMKIEGALTNLFFNVLRTFIDKGGAREIHFFGHDHLSDFFEARNEQIKEMLKN